jgi:hypothetical protein
LSAIRPDIGQRFVTSPTTRASPAGLLATPRQRARRPCTQRRGPSSQRKRRSASVRPPGARNATPPSPTGPTTLGPATCARPRIWQHRSANAAHPRGYPYFLVLPASLRTPGQSTPRNTGLFAYGAPALSVWATLALNHGDLVNAVQIARSGALIAVDDIIRPEGDSGALSICRLLEQRGILRLAK